MTQTTSPLIVHLTVRPPSRFRFAVAFMMGVIGFSGAAGRFYVAGLRFEVE